jgi:hypothetical protein
MIETCCFSRPSTAQQTKAIGLTWIHLDIERLFLDVLRCNRAMSAHFIIIAEYKMSGSLLKNFLAARSLIDMNAATPPVKEKANVMEKPDVGEMSVKTIIATKPSKKVVMDFLREKAKQYTDMSSSDDD